MSEKIKSKDLSYDSSLPPFLQRLHNQNAGRGDTDRHERPIARPKKSKDPNDDDGPTVVDESGETLSKDEYQKLTKSTEPGIEDSENVTGEVDPAAEPKASGALPDTKASDANVTDGTATKKRKVAKVIGQENETEESTGKGEGEGGKSIAKVAKKAKKKAKPVKLAFDDEEET